jgi:ABC-type transport system substrate-binding protein
MAHNDSDIMNPVVTPGWRQFQRMSFNGLIDYDMQGNIVPGLATPWEISEDGLTYTSSVALPATSGGRSTTY